MDFLSILETMFFFKMSVFFIPMFYKKLVELHPNVRLLLHEI